MGQRSARVSNNALTFPRLGAIFHILRQAVNFQLQEQNPVISPQTSTPIIVVEDLCNLSCDSVEFGLPLPFLEFARVQKLVAPGCRKHVEEKKGQGSKLFYRK